MLPSPRVTVADPDGTEPSRSRTSWNVSTALPSTASTRVPGGSRASSRADGGSSSSCTSATTGGCSPLTPHTPAMAAKATAAKRKFISTPAETAKNRAHRGLLSKPRSGSQPSPPPLSASRGPPPASPADDRPSSPSPGDASSAGPSIPSRASSSPIPAIFT